MGNGAHRSTPELPLRSVIRVGPHRVDTRSLRRGPALARYLVTFSFPSPVPVTLRSQSVRSPVTSFLLLSKAILLGRPYALPGGTRRKKRPMGEVGRSTSGEGLCSRVLPDWPREARLVGSWDREAILPHLDTPLPRKGTQRWLLESTACAQ